MADYHIQEKREKLKSKTVKQIVKESAIVLYGKINIINDDNKRYVPIEKVEELLFIIDDLTEKLETEFKRNTN
jgi:hypothetical protein